MLKKIWVKKAYDANKYLAIINAQFYAIDFWGKVEYKTENGAVDPSHITPEGLVVMGKGVIAGRAAPQNFYVANYIQSTRPYKFGFGSAPKDANSAIGGLGPLLMACLME